MFQLVVLGAWSIVARLSSGIFADRHQGLVWLLALAVNITVFSLIGIPGCFLDWRLMIDGLVARPSTFSLDEIKRMPARSQITHQACEEGWSFIAEWTGVPLSYVMNLVGVSEKAKFVVFYPFDESWDSLDLGDAYHAQTFLAYNLNGKDLPADHGAPLRVRVARQLGYKSVKYLHKLTLADSMKNVGDGRGSASPSYGYSWYAGI